MAMKTIIVTSKINKPALEYSRNRVTQQFVLSESALSSLLCFAARLIVALLTIATIILKVYPEVVYHLVNNAK